MSGLGVFLAAGATLASIAGLFSAHRSFNRRRSELVQTLHHASPAAASRTDLPPEVERLADRAGSPRSHPPRLVHFSQSGVMNVTLGGNPIGFTADQFAVVAQPAFLWDARVRFGPMSVTVLDALIDDAARLEARLFGTIRVANLSPSDAVYRGEAMRYLAELMWNPDAILFNREIVWRVMGGGILAAGIGGGSRYCEVRFHVDADGDVCRVTADSRPRAVGGSLIETPWCAEYSRYRTIGGRRIPSYGRVAWVIDGQEQVYWRGHIDTWTAVY